MRLFWATFNHFESAALTQLLHRHPRRNADGATVRDDTALRKLRDEDIGADLAALVAASHGDIALETLPRPRDLRHVEPTPDATELAPLPEFPSVAQAWRIASFTSLSAGGEASTVREEEGIDRDEVAAESVSEELAALQGFPRGRRPGTLVHKILELVDFTADDPAELRALVERHLGDRAHRRGVDRSSRRGAARRARHAVGGGRRRACACATSRARSGSPRWSSPSRSRAVTGGCR